MEETREARVRPRGAAWQSLACSGRGGVATITCETQPAKPYRLAFTTETDVICLLFGSIDAATAYDDAKPRRMRFEPMTIAWHPAGGRVAVVATRVTGGFAALTYPRHFIETLTGATAASRPSGSIENIASPSIGNLVSYARAALSDGAGEDRLALEMLANLAYLEAARGARGMRITRPHRALGLSEIARAIELIDAELSEDLTYAGIAHALGVPVTTLARAFRAVTGQNLHRYVLDRRIARARDLLASGATPLAEIALACGFSSQAHLTTMFASRVGSTPARYRAAVRNP